MKRFVLTGGPCAGKTTALSYIPEKLSDYGYSVVTMPEAATLLINAGVAPLELLSLPSRERYLRFEELIIKAQLVLERIFTGLLKVKDGSKQLLILDRGCMDVTAYLRPEEFMALMKKNRWTLVGLRDKRYDAVFHLVTAADGKEEFYIKDNNSARYESSTEAKESDKRTQTAWIGHPHLIVIDNSTLFEEKMKRLLKAVQNSLGIPTMLEIERKFLVTSSIVPTDIPVPYQEIFIEQAYLNNGSRIRKRSQNNISLYFQTRKIASSTPVVRQETERKIGEHRYYALKTRQDPQLETIQKRRICFVWKNQYFELDIFIAPKRLQGLILLEIELTEENDKVDLPGWLRPLNEVTNDPKYINENLAKRP